MWEGCNCTCLAQRRRCPRWQFPSSTFKQCWDGVPWEVCSPAPCTGRASLMATHHASSQSGPEGHNQSWPQSKNASYAWKAVLTPGRPQVMHWEGVWESWSSCRVPSPPNPLAVGRDSHRCSHLLLLPHPPFPYEHKVAGPSALGRKYNFCLFTRKPWVALYET